ncbi:vasopressin V1a receptor-like isoform X1 [Microplitis mediator]|uniref:vasopressin V1a receptor-like isoform X1 n=1 Tax=Microplitis mediator TaxID=375433 RepID=UPI00255431D4|nr:vasopressin V1a receptor-like isoform X1 [Microplitis mediator]
MMDNSTQPDTRDENLATWEIAVLVINLIITIIGNCFIFFALYLRRYHGRQRKLTRMYFFMLHLSIADFITGIFNVLPQLAWDITFRFQGGSGLCKIIKFLQPFGNYLSSYVLTATAIDRYQAICYPFNYCRTSSLKSRVMVYGAWSLSFVLCIPQVIVFSYQEISPGVWDCWASFTLPYGERIYVTWYSITVFLLPFLVLLYTYASICANIRRNTEISDRFDHVNNAKKINFSNKNRQPLISRAKIKTVKQMITVVSLYVITSSPFIGCQLWATWDPQAANSSFINGPAFTILTLMSSLTSCVNPWIYLGFNRELRIILSNYLKKMLCRQNVINYDIDTSYVNSNGSSTKSSIIVTMFRFAGSMYHRQTYQERSTDFILTRRQS